MGQLQSSELTALTRVETKDRGIKVDMELELRHEELRGPFGVLDRTKRAQQAEGRAGAEMSGGGV